MFPEKRIKPMSKLHYRFHPVGWFEEGAIIDNITAGIINGLVLKPLNTLQTVQWLITGTGVILMCISMGYAVTKVLF
jgi:hypothetical protein